MAKAFDDAVKLEHVAFKQPFNEAYEITDCSRRVKIVLDDYCVDYCRKEFDTADKRLCIENALEWVNA